MLKEIKKIILGIIILWFGINNLDLLPYMLLIFLAAIVIYYPFKYTYDSFATIIVMPFDLLKLFFNPAIKKNHSLEHGTINLLEREGYYFSGLATEEGFYIKATISPAEVRIKALEALELLNKGCVDIAIHKNCGTSDSMGKFLSALIFIGLFIYFNNFNLLFILIAIALGNYLGPKSAKYVQRIFTTSRRLKRINIEEIYNTNEKIPFLESKEGELYFVKTYEESIITNFIKNKILNH